MNNTFNINRIGLLIQRYFIENSRRELLYWGIITFVFMFFRNNVGAIMTITYFLGIFFATRTIKEIHSKTNGINYFMIPASQLEKLTTALLLSIVYFFGMILIAYVAGNIIGTFLNNLLVKVPFFSTELGLFVTQSSLNWELFNPQGNMWHYNDFMISSDGKNILILNFFLSFVISQSIFLFGGIYFKNNAVLKVFASIFLIVFAFVALAIFELWVLNGFNFGSMEFGDDVSRDTIQIFDTVANIFMYLLIPFFWITSYFRLTEKEV